jgi:hypothetical protein
MTLEALLREGVECFNRREFWEAHDVWERVWLESRGESKLFIQGLIQYAAAYFHIQRGTLVGAVRLFPKAARKLAGIDVTFAGIDRRELAARAPKHLKLVEELHARGDVRPFADAEFPVLGLIGA